MATKGDLESKSSNKYINKSAVSHSSTISNQKLTDSRCPGGQKQILQDLLTKRCIRKYCQNNNQLRIIILKIIQNAFNSMKINESTVGALQDKIKDLASSNQIKNFTNFSMDYSNLPQMNSKEIYGGGSAVMSQLPPLQHSENIFVPESTQNNEPFKYGTPRLREYRTQVDSIVKGTHQRTNSDNLGELSQHIFNSKANEDYSTEKQQDHIGGISSQYLDQKFEEIDQIQQQGNLKSQQQGGYYVNLGNQYHGLSKKLFSNNLNNTEIDAPNPNGDTENTKGKHQSFFNSSLQQDLMIGNTEKNRSLLQNSSNLRKSDDLNRPYNTSHQLLNDNDKDYGKTPDPTQSKNNNLNSQALLKKLISENSIDQVESMKKFIGNEHRQIGNLNLPETNVKKGSGSNFRRSFENLLSGNSNNQSYNNNNNDFSNPTDFYSLQTNNKNNNNNNNNNGNSFKDPMSPVRAYLQHNQLQQNQGDSEHYNSQFGSSPNKSLLQSSKITEEENQFISEIQSLVNKNVEQQKKRLMKLKTKSIDLRKTMQKYWNEDVEKKQMKKAEVQDEDKQYRQFLEKRAAEYEREKREREEREKEKIRAHSNEIKHQFTEKQKIEKKLKQAQRDIELHKVREMIDKFEKENKELQSKEIEKKKEFGEIVQNQYQFQQNEQVQQRVMKKMEELQLIQEQFLQDNLKEKRNDFEDFMREKRQNRQVQIDESFLLSSPQFQTSSGDNEI